MAKKLNRKARRQKEREQLKATKEPKKSFTHHDNPIYYYAQDWDPKANEAGEAMKELVNSLSDKPYSFFEGGTDHLAPVFLIFPYGKINGWFAMFIQDDGKIAAVSENQKGLIAYNWMVNLVETYSELFKEEFKRKKKNAMFDAPLLVTVSNDKIAGTNDVPIIGLQTPKKTVHGIRVGGFLRKVYSTPASYMLMRHKDPNSYELFLKLKDTLMDLQHSLEDPTMVFYPYFDDKDYMDIIKKAIR